MSDPASLSILPVVSSSEAGVAAGFKAPSKGSQNQNEGSFLDFLNAFNGLSSANGNAQDAQLNSGRSLPLSVETARVGHIPELVPATTKTQATGTEAEIQLNDPVLTALPQGVADTSLDENLTALPLTGNAIEGLQTKPDLSSRVSSAALASRLVGLSQAGNLPVNSAVATPGTQVASLTKGQIATLDQVNSDIESLHATAPLQLAKQGLIAPITVPVGKELLSKPGSVPVSSNLSHSAVNTGVDTNLSSREPIKLELSEADAFFSDQVKKMMSEQQFSSPEKQLNQGGLTPTTANSATTQPVSAAQFGIQIASPTLTTETVSVSGHQATISETFGRPEWNQGMGKQVLWMANQNIRSAELRLNPANLGPIEVRIDMDDDQVNLAFSSRHAAVREAVEQAMPRLREMFEESGLNLADTDVSQQSFAEQRSQESNDSSNQHAGKFYDQSGPIEADNKADPAEPQSLDLSLVDYYI